MFWPHAITAVLILGSLTAMGALLWFATGDLRKRWLRILACMVLTIPTWYAVSSPWIRRAAWKLSDGRWCCLVCGALERRITYGDTTLLAYSADESEITKAPKRFEDWYWRNIRVSHDHDWRLVGCHDYLLIAAVGCAPCYEPYFGSLPSLPDQEIAEWIVGRMIHADPAEREHLIRSRAFSGEELFGALAGGATMSRAEFDEAFARWQGEHPEWR